MDECAEAALQVLDAVNVREPVVVLGTSWGGMIAPRIVLLAPDRVRGIVLFNTTAESAVPFDRAKSTLLTKLLGIGALDNGAMHVVTNRRQGKAREYVSQFLRCSYREGGKVKKETVANLSDFPNHRIAALRSMLARHGTR